MNVIPLDAIPNQSFNVNINGMRHDFEINSRSGSMYVTLAIDGVVVMNNRALRSYAPITPYLVMINADGFNEEPHYSGFGTKFFLMSRDESV